MSNKNFLVRGFTLVELLIVIGLTIILVTATVPIYGSLQVKAQLSETSAQIAQSLRSARQNAIAGYFNNAYGVYFGNTVSPNFYTIYQGTSYATRSSSFDRVNTLDNAVSIVNVSLTTTTGGIDINFSKGLGVPNNIGSLNLTHSVQGSSTISVNALGKIQEQ